MKFLVDAQLPLRLCRLLIDGGHDVIHSSQLPNGNATPDDVIIQIADHDDRILISKDRDFEISHLLRGAPASLLLVTTGNISNVDLLDSSSSHLSPIVDALRESSFVELSSTAVIIHGSANRPSRSLDESQLKQGSSTEP